MPISTQGSDNENVVVVVGGGGGGLMLFFNVHVQSKLL